MSAASFDRDLVDAIADRRRHDREQLREAGADAGAEHRRLALPARRFDAVATGTEVLPGDERGRRHDVHPGREDAHELVGVGPHRVVYDAVGLQREQRVDVVRGGDAQRRDAAELARIAADLVGRPRVAADEFKRRVRDDRLYGALADVAGRPLDNPIALRVVHAHNLEPPPLVTTDLVPCNAARMTPEVKDLRAALDGQRAGVIKKLAGLSEADARRSPVDSGTNLAGLIQHLTFVESLWFKGHVAGEKSTGKRSMTVDPAVSLKTLRAGYRAACDESDAIIASVGDGDATILRSGKKRTLRSVLLVVIEETARHAGHADIIREQIDGTTGR